MIPTMTALSLLLLTGYAMETSAGLVGGGAPPLPYDLRLQLGTVALAPSSSAARFSFDKGEGKIWYASERAGHAAGSLLGTSVSDPLADAVIGVGTFVLAPVAAADAALSARKRLSPEKLSEREAELVKEMQETAAPEKFQEFLLTAASSICPHRLVLLEPGQSRRIEGSGTGFVMQSRVEELRLEKCGSGDACRLRITTRTRMVRTSDGAVLYDQPAAYQSGSALFLDWTLRDGFQSVAETGFRELAEHIVGQTLSTSDTPLLIGPAYKKASAQKQEAHGRLAGSPGPLGNPAVQLVSYPGDYSGTFQIYPGGDVPQVLFPRPLTREEANSEAIEDLEWSLDGLDKHPNLLVALPASLAAVPLSLWKQGAALVHGFSPERARAVEASLSEASKQTNPGGELAFQVAHQLAPQTSETVMLVSNPLPAGTAETKALTWSGSRLTPVTLRRRQSLDEDLVGSSNGTMLELSVQKVALTGTGGSNSKVALYVEAQATLLPEHGGQQLYTCPVRYRSRERKLTEWAAKDGKLFREELQHCYGELGQAIAGRLVNRRLVAPPASRPGSLLVRN
jgi:hypothetical protein